MTARAKAETLRVTGTRISESVLWRASEGRPMGGGFFPLLPKASQPEDKEDQVEEDCGDYRDHVRGVSEGRGHGINGGVAHDPIDMPVLADSRSGKAHEPHEPREGDREQDQHILRARRNRAPANGPCGPRTLEHWDVDGHDRSNSAKDSQHLVDRET